jgi:organic hydroperoxide reductase OsmC/OhrA
LQLDERSQVCGCAAEKWNRSVRLIAQDDQLNDVVGIHPAEQAIDADVDLSMTGDDCFLGARLNVSLAGLQREVAQALVNAAHQTCPYSKAIRGNVDVVINLV